MSAVLVADDEAGMRETLADILADSGYGVTSAADGNAALDAIRNNQFDVVVMDIRMPGRDGVSVLREVGEPTRERVLPPPLDTPPDMARLIPIGARNGIEILGPPGPPPGR